MSGTPVIPTDVDIKVITARVPDSAKRRIDYSKDKFQSEEEMVSHIKSQIKSGSVMVYCSSKIKVEEVSNLLIKHNIPVFSMTSIEMKENGGLGEKG